MAESAYHFIKILKVVAAELLQEYLNIIIEGRNI